MMNPFEIVATQTPGVINFSNYQEVKNALSEYVSSNYANVDYSLEGIDAAERDSKELKTHRDAIAKVKKEINAAYSAPYVEIEKKLDELIAILDVPLKKAKSYVDEAAKDEKRNAVYEYARKAAIPLGDKAEKVINSSAFFNPKWLNKTTSIKTVQDEIDSIVQSAMNDLSAIQMTGGESVGVLTARYYETLSMEGMEEFLSNMQSDESSELLYEVAGEKNAVGYKILKITATEDQMAFLLSQISLMGIDVEEIEDGMPKPMDELTIPDFDSFVAFDIETTGTNGAVNGDEEAKITEIGAVKVVNGEVVDRFDELSNPERKMVPRIARLTHITDEMLADKPPIDDVIKLFREFVGDSVLVGHNIKSSDLRYILKAADKAGVRFDNAFLDTYVLAKHYKEGKEWEKLNLGYLAKYYGFEHKEIHRAWSDADVNAQVYFELQKLYQNQ